MVTYPRSTEADLAPCMQSFESPASNSGNSINPVTEFDGLRVYDKPSGISLLADRSGEACLWDQLKGQAAKPYLVHRLDKGTSGTLLVATSQAAQSRLTKLFAEREVSKYYLAWVVGHFPMQATYVLNLPMCRGRKSRFRLAGPREAIKRQGNVYSLDQDREGVAAQTRVRCLAQGAERSLLLIKPVTGRTHQIRVHLSWLGHALQGDHLYGKNSDPRQQADRLMLHCHRLVVPGWGSFSTPPPTSFPSARQA